MLLDNLSIHQFIYLFIYYKQSTCPERAVFSLATPRVSLCLVSKAHTWKVKGQTAAPGRVSHLSAQPPGLFFQVAFIRATRQEGVLCNRVSLPECILGPTLGHGILKSESSRNAATGLKITPLVSLLEEGGSKGLQEIFGVGFCWFSQG